MGDYFTSHTKFDDVMNIESAANNENYLFKYFVGNDRRLRNNNLHLIFLLFLIDFC